MADINRIGIAMVLTMLACVSQASWYWPFGSSSEDEKEPPRLSELMEPASLLIDEASDFAADGKTSEAVEKYREALKRLDRIEAENPERASKPEFATLRNKRAYVSAAIDSLLLGQIKDNARAVAVSDTTELEKKLAAEKAGVKPTKAVETVKTPVAEPAPKPKTETAKKPPAPKPPARGPKAHSRREQAMIDLANGDFEAAKLTIDEMLSEKPTSPAALNLKAVMEIRQGKLREAELTLDKCIAANPRSYFAYYNMSELMLQKGNRTGAKRYYDTGRAYGGPKNPQLEKVLK